MPQLRAVFFDMGDTIVDLGEGRGTYEERVMRRVARVYDSLVARGVALPARDAFCQSLAADSEAQYQAALAEQIGIAAPAVMRRFLQAQGLPAHDDLVEAAAEAYCKGGPDITAPLRLDAVETLKALKARGLLLGAISNTIQPGRFFTTNTRREDLNRLFDARVYSSDVGVAKPHPKIFRTALEQVGVAAPEAVYVGDRLIPDIGGAQAVGMKGVLIEVAHRIESHPTIVPDAKIKELPEVLDVLPGLFEKLN
jgi:putative hydrolase of the HAD superfamily